MGLKKIDGLWYVVFRGSTSVLDWVHNLEAWLIDVPGMGRVHHGFYVSMPEIWPKIISAIGSDPWIVTGHSRGAGEATVCAAMAFLSSQPPLSWILFGSPRCGDQTFYDVIAKVNGYSFVNGSKDGQSADAVTELPIYVPEIFPYIGVTPVTFISNDPGPEDAWPGSLRFHHMQLYQRVVGTHTE